MVDDPGEFHDTRAEYDWLRQALIVLYGNHDVRSADLIRQAKLRCNRATIDKFRNGRTRRLNSNIANPLWMHLVAHYRSALALPVTSASSPATEAAADDPTAFFAAVSKYYHAHKIRSGPRMDWLAGRYRFFQYSEEFNHHSADLSCAIVIGEFRIIPKPGLVLVEERQAYDGQLGKTSMTETSSGICLPKGHEFFFLMKTGARETPKFCVFHKVHYDGQPRRAQWMKGYMLKGSYDEAYFHTPVYAVREDSEEIACNIVHPDDVPPHILAELNKEVPVARASPRRRPVSGRPRGGANWRARRNIPARDAG
jgi:hypothetical protein